MNEVPPDLAAKVLAANKRNVVKKVGDGGTLTSAEAGDFEAAVLSADTARAARAQALLVKWATAGRLTPAEERELETYHPGILSRGLAAAVVEVTTPMNTPADFALAVETPRHEITKAQLLKWSARYGGTSPRQIRRWLADGIKASDPCPLDDPHAFLRWWPRHMKWRPPDWLLKAAAQAAPVATDPAAPQKTLPAPAENATPFAGAAPFTPINLADFVLAEGEAVAQQRRLVAALYSQLERSYLQPGGEVDLTQSKYNKAVEALRKLEKDDREDQKQRGLLIPRAAVQRDLDAAAELLRQMRESMARRVLELATGLAPEQREAVTSAILRVREAEDRVFQRLPSLKPSELLAALAA